jgi:hypothetical protein
MGMSKESLGDLAKIQLSRRALLAGGLGFVALACTPSSPEIRPDVADGNQLSKVPPTPVAAKEIDPLAPINMPKIPATTNSRAKEPARINLDFIEYIISDI